MKPIAICLAIGIVTAAATATATAAPGDSTIPNTMSINARLADNGQPVNGQHGFEFRLFRDQQGGLPIWQESRTVQVDQGVISLSIGAATPLDPAQFDGQDLYLEIAIDGTTLSPRMALNSVPYAMRAHVASTAETIGGLGASDLQRRVSSSCPAGSSIRAISAAGSVTCETDDTNTGDITGVTAGTGLSGGGNSGGVTINADTSYLQRRIAVSCGTDRAIAAVSSSGTPTCRQFVRHLPTVSTYAISATNTSQQTKTTSSAQNFCALSSIATNVAQVNGTWRWCTVVRNSSGTWTLKARSNEHGSVSCIMTCF